MFKGVVWAKLTLMVAPTLILMVFDVLCIAFGYFLAVRLGNCFAWDIAG